MNNFGLGLSIDFRDNASQGLLNVSRVFNSTHTSAQNMIGAIDKNMMRFQALTLASAGLSKVGGAIQNAGKGILNTLNGFSQEAGSLERELQQLKFVTGATEQEFAKLKDTAIATGIKTAFSPQEATKAMYELKSAGLETKDMLIALDDVLNLVAVSGGEIDLSSGASLVANTLQKFNLSAENSKMIVDQLAQSTKVSNFHFADFSSFINSLQSAPTSLQRPLEEFLGAGALLRNIGQGAAQAGNTINGFGRQLMTITRQLENKSKLSGRTLNQIKFKAMEKIGLDQDTIWDAEGNLNSLTNIFEKLVTQMANMPQKEKSVIAQTLFGDQAKNLLLAVENAQKSYLTLDEATGKYIATTKEGKKSYEQMVEAIKNSKGVTEEGAKEMLSTFWGINKLWEGTKQTFSALMGETILPILGKFIGLLTDLTNKVLVFIQAHPKLARVLGLGIGLTGLFLLVTGGIIKFVAMIGLAIGGIGTFMFSLTALTGKIVGTSTVMTIASRLVGGFALRLKSLMLLAGKMALIFGGLYLAWNSDFLGVRTILTNFINGVVWAFNESSRIANLGANQFLVEVKRLQESDRFIDKVILGLVSLRVFWMALCDAWSDYTLSDDNFIKISELGLLPLLSLILDLKMRFDNFWVGFKEGWNDISRIVVFAVGVITEVLGPLCAFIYDLIFGVDEANKTVSKDIDLSAWKDFGYIVAILTGVILGYKAVVLIASAVTAIIGVVSSVASVGVGLLAGAFAFLTSPIGLAILAILAVIAVIWLLVDNWELIKAKTMEALQYMAEGITWFIETVLAPIGDFFASLFFAPVQTVLVALEELFSAFLTFVKDIFDGIVLIFSGLTDFIVGVFTGNWQQAWEGVKAIFKGVFDSFVGIAKAPINGVIALINGLIGGLNLLKFPDWVPVIGGKGIDIPKIPQLNTGGYIKNDGMAMLHQDEVVVNAPLTKRLGEFLESTKSGNTSTTPTKSNNDNQSIDNSVVFNEGAIQVTLASGSNEDAESFAKLIMEKIQKKQQLERIRNYQFR